MNRERYVAFHCKVTISLIQLLRANGYWFQSSDSILYVHESQCCEVETFLHDWYIPYSIVGEVYM